MQVDKCVQVGNVTLMFNKQSNVSNGQIYHYDMFVLGVIVIGNGAFDQRAYTIGQIASLIGAYLLDVTLSDYQLCVGHDKTKSDWYDYLAANINASYQADIK